MKILLLCVVFVAFVNGHSLGQEEAMFQAFKAKYGKTYTAAEEVNRFAIFKEHLRSIDEHNALYDQGLISWKKEINKFADLTDDEYRALLGLHHSQLPEVRKTPKRQLTGKLQVPDSVDWRNSGAVTPVLDQGSCGASWASAIVGSVEAAYFIKTGKLIELSVQQLLDCTAFYGNDGCNSGHLRENMPYIMYQGLESNGSYPYKAESGECQYNASSVVTKIDNWVTFADNQYQFEQALANYGPIAASLDARELKTYAGGIYTPTACSIVNPTLAVLVVGYGSEDGVAYWIARTPLGTTWGEDGYFRIQKSANNAACGLFRQPVYPVIY